MTAGRAETSAAPELACAVLSLGGDPRLVDAVRSLREQSCEVEIVVVNSGGGTPRDLLREAGLDVPVIDRPERLLPGGVRNLGIDATRAPYVSFLAADCRAEPGWAARRLMAHRAGAAAVSSVMSPGPLRTRSECASMLLTHLGRLDATPPALRRRHGLSYHRSLFERHGRFREDMRAGEDSELNERIWEREEVAWAAGVRTAHDYAATPGALIRDQYRRGRRASESERRHLHRIGAFGTVVEMIRRLPLRLRIAAAMPNPAERRRLLRSWPLLVPGTVAHLAGVFVSAWRVPRRDPVPALPADLTGQAGGGAGPEPQPLADLAR